MWVELVLCLVLAHLVADFALQTNKICKDKSEKKWTSLYLQNMFNLDKFISESVTLTLSSSLTLDKA